MNSDLLSLAHKAGLASAFAIMALVVCVNGAEACVLIFWAVFLAFIAGALRILAK